MIEFRIPKTPVAQPRPRAGVLNGKARIWKDAKHPVNAFKQLVRVHARLAYGVRDPLTGPLAVRLLFVLPLPKGEQRKTKLVPRRWHQSAPDCDNLAKAVLDAVKGLLWVDDGQVAFLEVAKRVAAGNESAHVGVRVARLEEA